MIGFGMCGSCCKPECVVCVVVYPGCFGLEHSEWDGTVTVRVIDPDAIEVASESLQILPAGGTSCWTLDLSKSGTWTIEVSGTGFRTETRTFEVDEYATECVDQSFTVTIHSLTIEFNYAIQGCAIGDGGTLELLEPDGTVQDSFAVTVIDEWSAAGTATLTLGSWEWASDTWQARFTPTNPCLETTTHNFSQPCPGEMLIETVLKAGLTCVCAIDGCNLPLPTELSYSDDGGSCTLTYAAGPTNDPCLSSTPYPFRWFGGYSGYADYVVLSSSCGGGNPCAVGPGYYDVVIEAICDYDDYLGTFRWKIVKRFLSPRYQGYDVDCPPMGPEMYILQESGGNNVGGIMGPCTSQGLTIEDMKSMCLCGVEGYGADDCTQFPVVDSSGTFSATYRPFICGIAFADMPSPVKGDWTLTAASPC